MLFVFDIVIIDWCIFAHFTLRLIVSLCLMIHDCHKVEIYFIIAIQWSLVSYVGIYTVCTISRTTY